MSLNFSPETSIQSGQLSNFSSQPNHFHYFWLTSYIRFLAKYLADWFQLTLSQCRFLPQTFPDEASPPPHGCEWPRSQTAHVGRAAALQAFRVLRPVSQSAVYTQVCVSRHQPELLTGKGEHSLSSLLSVPQGTAPSFQRTPMSTPGLQTPLSAPSRTSSLCTRGPMPRSPLGAARRTMGLLSPHVTTSGATSDILSS